MRKEKRWWQQEVDCCPVCGSVDIRWQKRKKEYVCNRSYCGTVFATPIIANRETRPHIRELRRAYSILEHKHDISITG